MEKTIAPCNWNDEHAAPSWLCLTASPATVARAKLKARLREEATAARVSREEYLPHSTGEGLHYGEIAIRNNGTNHGGTGVPHDEPKAKPKRRRARFSPLVVKAEPRPWQPSCETCSPIVAPACGKICPDLGLVNEIMERWRTA